MGKKQRLFFAVEVPEEIKIEFAEFCRSLDLKAWRPVKPGQMHITLAFMEAVDEDLVQMLFDIGDSLAAKFSRFQLEIAETGVFPEIGVPRVLFAQVASEGLVSLANSLQEKLEGLIEPRSFKAHLTLARKKNELATKVDRTVRGSWEVGSFTLFKSTLSSDGPLHEILRRFSLK